MQTAKKSLDFAHKDCNQAFQTAFTKIQKMIENEDQWLSLQKRLKLCSAVDGRNSKDIEFLYFIIAWQAIGMTVQQDSGKVCRKMTEACHKEPIDCLADVLENPFG